MERTYGFMIAFLPDFSLLLLGPLLVAIAVLYLLITDDRLFPRFKKSLFIFITLSVLLFLIPSLLAGVSLLSYWKIIAMGSYFLEGCLYLHVFKRVFGRHLSANVLNRWMVMICIACLGGIFFMLTFTALSKVKPGGVLLLCCIPFFIPQLLYDTWVSFRKIPFPIYAVWEYDVKQQPYCLDDRFNNLSIIKVELKKLVAAEDMIQVKVKISDTIPWGVWFQRFLHDYNYRCDGLPIQYHAEDGMPYCWIFYRKSFFLSRNRWIDPEKNMYENRIRENSIIIAKRVIQK